MRRCADAPMRRCADAPLAAARAHRLPAQKGYALRSLSRDAVAAGAPEPWAPGRLHPDLSWTHYRVLMRVERLDARSFYEIETIRNVWSARELERQTGSLLFERLAKSKDKAGLLRLATRGQEIATITWS